MIILIPAYEPDERLVTLVASLLRTDPSLRIVIVDDGSGPAHTPLFEAVATLGCAVRHHRTNHGKGAALKTGLAYVARTSPGEHVVCADSDGQHTVPDILRVAEEVRRRPHAIVLGAREFAGPVPARSRLGNDATRWAFGRATGLRLRDTQTGLRGYRAETINWLLTVPGERFEYEMNVLLLASREDRAVLEVPIETVYLDGNRSSHFRPLADSALVYEPLLLFATSSLTAFVLDLFLVLVLVGLTGSLLLSVVTARLVSSAVNFLVNRGLVFAQPKSARIGAAAVRYYALAVCLLAANYVLLRVLTLAVPLMPAKLVTEALLFGVSYTVQRRRVFPHDLSPHSGHPVGAAEAGAERLDPGSADRVPALAAR